ncbi:MAG TPA: O-succinylhomoserine sulfhydrylase [Gammaproteobacteria bacterium]|nr:O-succinylhomoserine sulfhydrylase [Gammaproteobacteria bacterium]
MAENARTWLRPCTRVYLLLMALTLVTWAVGRMGLQGLGVTFFVLGLALLKGELIGDWFMGLRGVQGIWRWVIALWLVLVGLLVGAAFWLSAG